jgi:iron complex outermembrane receptor protein
MPNNGRTNAAQRALAPQDGTKGPAQGVRRAVHRVFPLSADKPFEGMRALPIQPGSRVVPVPSGRRRLRLAVLFGCLLSAAAAVPAQETRPSEFQVKDLADVSLEQLSEIRVSVSSFARKDEDPWRTPAAVFVISREDIERSAASSIPELLRMVPGVQVAQIDASTWAVSIRGFNSALADKLLVLLDGRTVYSEAFSGTQWDQVDLPLQDIERIEVVRGPGGAIWGTNAVNGVVNIITRTARGETGLRLSASVGGVADKAESNFGGNLSTHGDYRAYASFHNLRAFPLASGAPAFDGEKSVHAGGRLDWNPRPDDTVTTSGDLYTGSVKTQLMTDLILPGVVDSRENGSLAGGYLLTRWDHVTPSGGRALQLSFSDQSRHELNADIRTRVADLDFLSHTFVGSHQDLVFGAELRLTVDRIVAVVPPTVSPTYFNPLGGAFIQDEIRVLPRKLFLTLGTRIEDGSLAGFQFEPTGRLLWAPTPNQSLWAAISRNAVAPSVETIGLNVPLNLGVYEGLPVVGHLNGNPAYQPETVTAYELGYRTRFSKAFTLDLAAFHNSNFRVQSLSIPSSVFSSLPTPHVDTVLLFGNGFQARSEGVEASISSNPLPSLSLQAAYAWMQSHSTRVDPVAVGTLDNWNTPHTSLSASASWAFAHRWTLNGFLSHIGKLPLVATFPPGTTDALQPSAPAYTRLDLHIARKLGRALELDAGVTNLLSPRHAEFGAGTGFTIPASVPRSAFLKAAWSF